MAEYEVTIPIAGHAYLTVEADSGESAIKKAMEEVTQSDIESWQAVLQFHRGNVCYCPRPWEAEATCVSGPEESDSEGDEA